MEKQEKGIVWEQEEQDFLDDVTLQDVKDALVLRLCLVCIRGIMLHYFSRCCSSSLNIHRYGFCLL